MKITVYYKRRLVTLSRSIWIKKVKFNRRKHKQNPWITFGIPHSINRKILDIKT